MNSRVPAVFAAFRDGGVSFEQKLRTLRAFFQVASAAEMAQFVGEMRAMSHARAARAEAAARQVVAASGIAPRANAAMDRAMLLPRGAPQVIHSGNVSTFSSVK